ncbi:MFS transporter [Eubacterium sp.]|uniref:MFS transporter n=1 Tax=Eubacterium sp. TaxID=142586 RepID=UPI003F03E31F
MKNNHVKLWNKNFIIIIVINFLIFLNHLMVLSTFPIFITDVLDGTDSISGMCATVFSLVAVICRPFVGWMLDNGKRKIILVVGITGMALMPMGYLMASTAFASLALAIICRMAHGVSLACSNTSTSTVATDIIPKQRFGEGMGMFGMATALATACAPAIGEALIQTKETGEKSFTLLFSVATAIMILSLVLFSFLKVPKIEIEKKPLSVKSLVDKDALPASATVLVFLITYGALENFILKFSEQTSDITISGGIYFTLMAVVLFLTRITIGKLADKKGEAIFVYTCNASMLVALLLLAIAPSNVTFIISALLSGYAFGGVEPSLQAMAVSIAPPEKRGSANSTFLCAYDIGIGVGGGIAGVLIDSIGYNKMFGVIAIANIISVIIYVFIGKNHPSSITYRIKNKQV